MAAGKELAFGRDEVVELREILLECGTSICGWGALNNEKNGSRKKPTDMSPKPLEGRSVGNRDIVEIERRQTKNNETNMVEGASKGGEKSAKVAQLTLVMSKHINPGEREVTPTGVTKQEGGTGGGQRARQRE